MFRRSAFAGLAAAVLLTAAAVMSARLATAPATASTQTPLLKLPRAAAAGQMTLFGHIRSLKATGSRFELRFDPALWLTGMTAQRASGSKDVPNDYFILDETNRLLSYVVPAGAQVTILTRGTNTTGISVARLARRVAHGWTQGQGFWILVGNKYPSPVLSLDQQYQP